MIYETEHFILSPFRKAEPHVSREEGGHLKLATKYGYEKLTDASPEALAEHAWLLSLIGEAYPIAMNNRGVPVIWVNYQTMGQWAFKKSKSAGDTKPHFHTQIYGRVADAKKQIWPEAVQLPDRKTGFYDGFVPLNDEDCAEIRKQMDILLKTEKYDRTKWRLK